MDISLILIFIFATIGLPVTFYLIYNMVRKTEVRCIVFPQEWCRKVQYSSYSKTLGIPNGVAGFGMYSLILILAFLFWQDVTPLWPLQIIIAVGFLFSLYFTFVQAFILKAFCTWCVISAINFVVMAVAAFIL